ncbi:MAG TPA: D-amino acid aminotransferase [Alphaproteobacteria bacterium]|nr:D-amino acid aminotransferase [Paracoccaceae bacterium]RCL81221.1 MAG: D-amino-acid transaminase [SAR116 cluster bacterium]RPH14337.1 MAG: D-amino-acid transaminase [Alphaproteobacteria bacterium TMED150]HCY48610.1 D-amino acid aminotransferase [Alphaproteobacteria bacterium]|tara:strand:+ start:2409 stop:3260 length:852 start_codon:yes stop_codon:yes gene_type:complete
MPSYAFVDGQYMPRHLAQLPLEDRATNFGDGIYEVWVVAQGKLVDEQKHFARLERSLGELQIPMPMGRPALAQHIQRLIRRNNIRFGTVYLQISRGASKRDHVPAADIVPSLTIFTNNKPALADARLSPKPLKIITGPDLRWARRDIKSTSLLPNVMLRMEAHQQGCHEAWMVDDQGFVTEGTSSSSWIVTPEKVVVTRALTNDILPGVTRDTVRELMSQSNHKFEERAFSVEEAEQAAEAFITSATNFVGPVVEINGVTIGHGQIGEVTTILRDLYLRAAGL